MTAWDKYTHKGLYNKIIYRIMLEDNFDYIYNRYIFDLKDGFVFYYLLTGKVVKETPKEGYVERIVIFKDKYTPYQLIGEIKALLNEIKL